MSLLSLRRFPAHRQDQNNFDMDLPWAKGSISVDGQTFADGGIRFKGNGMIGDAAHTIKKSLKIDLDRFGGTARFGGTKTINLGGPPFERVFAQWFDRRVHALRVRRTFKTSPVNSGRQGGH